MLFDRVHGRFFAFLNSPCPSVCEFPGQHLKFLETFRDLIVNGLDLRRIQVIVEGNDNTQVFAVECFAGAKRFDVFQPGRRTREKALILILCTENW